MLELNGSSYYYRNGSTGFGIFARSFLSHESSGSISLFSKIIYFFSLIIVLTFLHYFTEIFILYMAHTSETSSLLKKNNGELLAQQLDTLQLKQIKYLIHLELHLKNKSDFQPQAFRLPYLWSLLLRFNLRVKLPQMPPPRRLTTRKLLHASYFDASFDKLTIAEIVPFICSHSI